MNPACRTRHDDKERKSLVYVRSYIYTRHNNSAINQAPAYLS